MVAAIASLCLIAKTFDWLRLFEGTAFFIRLIEETLYDITFFLLLMILGLLMITIPFLLISFNWDQREEHNGFGHFQLYSFSTYLMMLGEF